jgi:hypothetical protein
MVHVCFRLMVRVEEALDVQELDVVLPGGCALSYNSYNLRAANFSLIQN